MPKPIDKKYLTVLECPNCHQEEYYGMMYWFDNRMMCRSCYKKMTRNGEDIKNFFPLWEDGVDYTIPQEENKDAS